ncbi:MAG: ankyrin repeat domain-containing protein [Trueperaceae bacterium]|nr:ankyrin repeat domain-containing protein [Trueperaceae bacterium]
MSEQDQNSRQLLSRRLLEAAKMGNDDTIRDLISAGADVKARDPQTQYTVLMHAAETNPNPEVLEILLEAGADPNDSTAPAMSGYKRGFSALHCAAANTGNSHGVQALLDAGANPTAVNEGGQTALYFAYTADAVQSLVHANAGLGRPKPATTPYHTLIAASAIGTQGLQVTDLSPAIRELAVSGIDPCSYDSNGFTPLMLVAGVGFGNLNVLQAIVDLSKQCGLELRNDQGQTALHVAATSMPGDDHNLSVIGSLLLAGADVSARGSHGITPLEMAKYDRRLAESMVREEPTVEQKNRLKHARAIEGVLKASTATQGVQAAQSARNSSSCLTSAVMWAVMLSFGASLARQL